MDTYSVKEIADMLNTNPETVRRWIRSGNLEAIQESFLMADDREVLQDAGEITAEITKAKAETVLR